MSRMAKRPVAVPSGIEAKVENGTFRVKGPKGEFDFDLLSGVDAKVEDGEVVFEMKNDSKTAKMNAGTTRAIINNMVKGANEGFEKKLTIIGVGYRAQAQGNKLNLTLGFSHPVVYDIPTGITIETPSNTEIVVKGADKQKVGQVAADIRAYRPPEPYKGKGVRYSDEYVARKQAKKK